MNCPDWAPLTAHRFERHGRPPRQWRAALEHLAGCGACRRAALEIDPTIVFLGLEGGPAAGPGAVGEEDEVQAMRAAVRQMRRTSEVEGSLRARGRRRAGLAAAALLALVLPFWPQMRSLWHGGGVPAGPASPPATFYARGLAPAAATSAPLVEALDRPQARVYQFGQEDPFLVMIVDENLDV